MDDITYDGPAPGPLGWIPFRDRTNEQNDAHERAMGRAMRFSMPRTEVPKGTKVDLTNLWRNAAVIADIGLEFTGFHQLTGSCVGASEGNAVANLSFVQRLLTSGATIALLPWWLFPYGRTRYNEGDRGQGEGAVDSVMGETLRTEGVFSASVDGLPTFNTDDGLTLTKAIELQWSDGGRIDQKWRDLAKVYPVGGVAQLRGPEDIRDSIVNGYPVLDGCDNYVGHGTIKGDGDGAYVTGRYDGRGGHSTCFLGYHEHPNDGPLFLYSNQWPRNTYPKDPAGAGRCCVWLPLSEVTKLFRTGGAGQTMALSHLTYMPAQPAVLDWASL